MLGDERSVGFGRSASVAMAPFQLQAGNVGSASLCSGTSTPTSNSKRKTMTFPHLSWRGLLEKVGQPFAILLLSGILGLCLLAGSHVRLLNLQRELNRLSITSRRMGAELAYVTAGALTQNTDFVVGLPAVPRVENLLRDASAWSAASAGGAVQLISASTQLIAATDRLLGRSDMSLQVRGRYADVKNWLRELLARYPSLALLGMDLHRDPAPVADGIQATVRLRLYAQPRLADAQSTASVSSSTAPPLPQRVIR